MWAIIFYFNFLSLDQWNNGYIWVFEGVNEVGFDLSDFGEGVGEGRIEGSG